MRPNAQSKIHPLNNNYDSEEIAPSAHDNSHTTFPLYELNQSEPDIQNSKFPKEENGNSNKPPKSSNKCICILSLIIVIQSAAIGFMGYYFYTENENNKDKYDADLERLTNMFGEQNKGTNTELGVLNNSTERIEDFIKNGGDSTIILNSKGYVSKEGVFGVQLEWSSRGAISITEANCSLTGSYIEEGINSFGKKNILNLESDHEYKYKITCREGENVNIISASTYTRTPLLIEDCDSLMKIGETHQTLMKNYYMSKDIDCSGQTFNPIGNTADKSFQGSLNGFNHTISNLTISTTGQPYVAIFGFCYSCSITNLKLSNSSVTGDDDYTALLIGQGSKSFIENVNVSGRVNGNDVIGGIVGRLESGSIKYCSADITLSGVNKKAGGLVGEMIVESRIKESFAKGSIIMSGALKRQVGGLCGYCKASSIIDSYAQVNISAAQRVGGLVGELTTAAYLINAYSVGIMTATVDHSPTVGFASNGAYTRSVYWDTDVSGTLSADWGTGLTTSQMKLLDSFLDFDFDNVWYIQQNSQYPILRWELDN